MNEAYLCLGGNLGNCEENFAKALKILERRAIRTVRRSPVYTSEPWGMQNVPGFYNQALLVLTNHSAGELMKILLETEEELGRKRVIKEHYESRIIDIDLLFFNKEVIESDSLVIPHPRLELRKFVLEPLNDIAPAFVHPKLEKTVAELLLSCPDKSQVNKPAHAL